jgi:hypothetical protein
MPSCIPPPLHEWAHKLLPPVLLEGFISKLGSGMVVGIEESIRSSLTILVGYSDYEQNVPLVDKCEDLYHSLRRAQYHCNEFRD